MVRTATERPHTLDKREVPTRGIGGTPTSCTLAGALFAGAGLAILGVAGVPVAGPMAALYAVLLAIAAGCTGAVATLILLHRRHHTITQQATAAARDAMMRDLDDALVAARSARDSAVNEMRLRTETFARASHELRTPLNAILGYGDLIRLRKGGDAIDDRYLAFAANIVDAGRHMLDVVTEVLDFGQLDAGAYDPDFKEVEIGDTCSEVLRLCHVQANEKGIALWCEAPPDLPKVRADKRAVRQMLLNLVGNAIKFSPEGGAVTVRAWADAAGSEGNKALRIAVCDTGPGIPKDEIHLILDSFRRASNTRHSTVGHGLGLAITAALVELHGGDLSVANIVGGGAEFVISLPLTEPASEDVPAPMSEAA